MTTTPRITVALAATVTRAQIPELCARLAERLRQRGPGMVACDVAGVDRPDVVTVEALARLQLTARRYGWRLVVAGAGPQLRRLIALLGLTDALVESGCQSEQREQAGGVEEAVDPRDPAG